MQDPFDGIKYFKRSEVLNGGKSAWGDPDKISHDLLLELDRLRANTGSPIVVTSAAWTPNTGHSDASQHYLGLAADIRCKDIPYMDFYLMCERFNFTGLGLYDTGFIHVDIRQIKNSIDSRWIRIWNQYVEFNSVNFLKVCSLAQDYLKKI